MRIRDTVTEVSAREWRVLSAVSGNTYKVEETDEGFFCSCKTRPSTVCRHMCSAVRQTLLDPDRERVNLDLIEAGDRVLVSEAGGHRWHTVAGVSLGASGTGRVRTNETDYPFSIRLVVRHERARLSLVQFPDAAARAGASVERGATWREV